MDFWKRMSTWGINGFILNAPALGCWMNEHIIYPSRWRVRSTEIPSTTVNRTIHLQIVQQDFSGWERWYWFSEVIFKGVFCKLDTLFRSVRKNILVLGAVYRFTIFVSSCNTKQFLNICFVIMLKLLSNYLSSGNCPRKYTRLTDPKLIWSPPTCYSTLLHSSQSFHCI